LNNQIILGIGFEIARGLGKTKGVTCILTSRDEEAGKKAVEELQKDGAVVEFFQLDITNRETIENLAKEIEKRGGLDILVNNAGMAYKGNTFGPEEAKYTIDTNFRGTMHMCDHFVPLMKNRENGGRIINVCSVAGKLSQVSSSLQKEFTSTQLTRQRLEELADKFVEDIKQGIHKEEGNSLILFHFINLSIYLFY